MVVTRRSASVAAQTKPPSRTGRRERRALQSLEPKASLPHKASPPKTRQFKLAKKPRVKKPSAHLGSSSASPPLLLDQTADLSQASLGVHPARPDL